MKTKISLLASILIMGILRNAWSQNPAPQWVQDQSYSYGNGSVYDVVSDPYGAVFVTTVNNYGSGILLKYNDSGQLLWEFPFADHGWDMAADALGNVVVVSSGIYWTNQRVFKVDPDGQLLWEFLPVYPGSTFSANTVAIDPSGNIYLKGARYYYDSGIWDDEIVKLDSDGNVWYDQIDPNTVTNWDNLDIAVNSSGMVAVAGYIHPDTYHDARCLLYNASGDLLWERTVDGSAVGTPLQFQGVALDESGNVYVTGDGYNSLKGGQTLTVKYDMDGNEAWSKTYDLYANFSDRGFDIKLDASGNVLVASQSVASTGLLDFVTIKYDSDGNQLWAKKYGGSSTSDLAFQLETVGDEVYVSGTSGNSLAVVKYDGNGLKVWEALKSNGVGYGYWNVYADPMTITVNGDIVVSADDWSSPLATVDLFSFSAGGASNWSAAFNTPSPDQIEVFKDFTADSDGNTFTVGSSSTYSWNYNLVKTGQDGKVLWLKHVADGTDSPQKTALDGSGNILLAGQSITTDYFMSVIKHDPSGNKVWRKIIKGEHQGPGMAQALAVNASGNSFVTGYTSDGLTGKRHITTAGLDAGGNLLWQVNTTAEEMNDFANASSGKALTLDENGNVYVTGILIDTTDDTECERWGWVVLKIDPAGNVLWQKILNSSFIPDFCNRYNEGLDISLDPDGNIVAAGYLSDDLETYYTYSTYIVKMDPDGNEIWRNKVSGLPGYSNYNWISGPMAIDDAGNIYAAGGNYNDSAGHYSMFLAKFAPAGNQEWVHEYEDPVSGYMEYGQASGVLIETDGTISVSGNASGSVLKALYLKYDPYGNLLGSYSDQNNFYNWNPYTTPVYPYLIQDGKGGTYLGSTYNDPAYGGFGYRTLKFCNLGASVSASSTSFCPGSSVTLTASAGDAFLWNTGETTQSIEASQGGEYSVTITNLNGCSAVSAGFQVDTNTVTEALITVNGPLDFCEGGSVQLTATAGAASYLWSTGATTAGITAEASGTYSVTVTGSNGCSATSVPVAVLVYELPEATITPSGSLELCAGNSVELNASPGAFYQWSTGEFGQVIEVSEAGDYFVVVTDLNGCSSLSASVTVSAGCDQPSNITANEITSSSVKLDWLEETCAIEYDLRYRQSGATEWINLQVSAMKHQKQLVNLLPGTEYEFQVQTICSASGDSSGFTNSVFVTMAVSCLPADDLSTTGITAKSAELLWQTDQEPDQWMIQYRPEGGNWKNKFVSGSASTFTLKGLAPSTAYEWRLRARCGAEYSGLPAVQDFTTLPLKEQPSQEHAEWQISVYPNPAMDRVQVDLSAGINHPTIQLCDVTGRILFTAMPGANPEEGRVVFDLSDLVSGSYYIRVISGPVYLVKELLVVH